MSVIQLDIDDALIRSVGAKAMKAFIEQQVAILRLKYQGEHLARTMRESGVDHDKEVSEARQEAWDEYKAACLRDLV
jgi:hypothetical protein